MGRSKAASRRVDVENERAGRRARTLKTRTKAPKWRSRTGSKLLDRRRQTVAGPKASPRRDTGLQASAIAPGDARLREFVADLYAAMSMMRLLRQEIASSLSLTSAEYSVLLAVWYLEREKEMTVRRDRGPSACGRGLCHIGGYAAGGKGPADEEAGSIGSQGRGREPDKGCARSAVDAGAMLREINRPLFTGSPVHDLTTVHRFLRAIIEHGREAIERAQSF